MKSYKLILGSILILEFGLIGVTSAHVVVKPSQVGIGSFQTFTVGVPVEKDVPTIALRLIIPEGLTYVSPNVKPGWQISIKKNGSGPNATTTEIDWIGGRIPAGFRDEFVFSAKVPATAATLKWKAYQTYSDGSVVSWDRESIEQPKGQDGTDDFSSAGPYSKTQVIDDLSTNSNNSPSSGRSNEASLILNVVSLVLSILALTLVILRRRKIRRPIPKESPFNNDVRF